MLLLLHVGLCRPTELYTAQCKQREKWLWEEMPQHSQFENNEVYIQHVYISTALYTAQCKLRDKWLWEEMPQHDLNKMNWIICFVYYFALKWTICLLKWTKCGIKWTKYWINWTRFWLDWTRYCIKLVKNYTKKAKYYVKWSPLCLIWLLWIKYCLKFAKCFLKCNKYSLRWTRCCVKWMKRVIKKRDKVYNWKRRGRGAMARAPDFLASYACVPGSSHARPMWGFQRNSIVLPSQAITLMAAS